MQHFDIFVANAFGEGPFTGNPAAVVPLDEWPADELLQAMAEQHNLAETAYVDRRADAEGRRRLRWFTPAREVRLCGHATLATAAVLDRLEATEATGNQAAVRKSWTFDSLSGELQCLKAGEGTYTLDFPADAAYAAPDMLEVLSEVVGRQLEASQVFVGQDDAMIVLSEAAQVLAYEPQHAAIRRVPRRGVILTAPASSEDAVDVVSRCFYPEFGVDEDPVTGSAHTLLGPYWCKRLGRQQIVCRQASRRGGRIEVAYRSDLRVELTGRVDHYLNGKIGF